MCVTISYKATVSAVIELSKHRKVPIDSWIKEGAQFKFVGDNVDKKKGVRDMRADHHGEMKHMFSIIAVKSRVTFQSVDTAVHSDLESLRTSMILPSADDVSHIKNNHVVIVSRILCKYIQCLSSFSSAVIAHIPHTHSEQMAKTSETFVLDVLPKNEAKHSDMIEIMQELQKYIGASNPSRKVISGGDQLTCERQVCGR